MNIPAEVISWFRGIFAASNRRLAEKIQNVPAIHEPHLDTTLVEHLMGYSTPRIFPSGWGIRIETHYLGGLRHFNGWEIADIGVFVFFQCGGSIIRQKVALLQSKRLYPKVGEINHLEEYDYLVGMARLGQRDKRAPSMLSQRLFTFEKTSRYQALHAHDRQFEAIGKYTNLHHIPVFYLFYNPPTIPLHVQVPITQNVDVTENPFLGSRVVPYRQVAEALSTKAKGYSPSLKDLASDAAVYDYGWRLEHFMADLLLSCKEGRRFTDADSHDMGSLFYRRSGPIAATVAVTVEVPEGKELSN
ncbi:MAG: hypothetical protein OXC41_06655 [Gammaproteobacteria bacterium]|nr:hypothetical protein [Gammaproteobacteria bacterium]